jgi:hypothetical protein
LHTGWEECIITSRGSGTLIEKALWAEIPESGSGVQLFVLHPKKNGTMVVIRSRDQRLGGDESLKRADSRRKLQ